MLLPIQIYIIEHFKPDKIISNCHLKIKFNEKAAFLFFFPNFKAIIFLGDEGVFNLIPKFLGNERYE